ncbi:mother of FT and TFL1-like protein [Carex littledalei]|uniref:Mother of FT and TFL1-like protein n=1 Tax=Carex littledalei TaxID=544730 RepID=A0A833VBQ1_9POAL|nr:mother of FT and TFL1-like protein [Carex littledalei]
MQSFISIIQCGAHQQTSPASCLMDVTAVMVSGSHVSNTKDQLNMCRPPNPLRFCWEVAVPYMGPQPPVGIHRYVFVLFKQETRLTDISPPANRAHFNTRSFAAEHNLGLPVAAAYFNSQKEPGINRRR